MRKLFLFLFIFLFFQALYAQDLSVPVTIHSDGASLKDVCDYLSQQTKLNIKAGKDQNDWLVYDRKSIIHVDNVPLKNLMISMSNVFDLNWESGEDGTIYLTLPEDKKINELKLREEYFKNKKEDFAKNQKGIYDALINKSSNSAYAQDLYNSQYYVSLVDFFNAFPKITNLILEKNCLKFDFYKLNEKQQNIIKKLTYNYIEYFGQLQPELQEKIDIFQNDDLKVEINAINSEIDDDIENDSVFSKIMLKSSKQTIEIIILNPDGKYTSILYNALQKAKNGEKLEEINKKLLVEIIEFKGQILLNKQVPCENLVGDDFSKKIDLLGKSNGKLISYNNVLKTINDLIGVNIVSDCYYRKNYDVDQNLMSLKSYLQEFSNFYDVKVKNNNNILEIQDKYYFIKIASVVPMAWIDYWVVRAYENQGYSIDDLLTISKLNDLQIDIEIRNNPDLNKVEDKDLRFSTSEVVNKRNILRFLASLSEDLLKKCYNGSISAYDLNDVQWKLLQDGLADQDAFYVPEEKSSQSISLRRNVANVVEYTLTYTQDLSSEPIDIIILTNKLTIKNKGKK